MEISLGAAAFWIALAAVLISGGWFKSRSEATKHETIRRIIEKTGEVDEVKLRALFEPPVNPAARARQETIRDILAKTEQVDEALAKELLQPPPNAWDSKPGDGYRAMQVGGTVLLITGLGMVIFFSFVYFAGPAPRVGALFGLGMASVFALLGAGLLCALRFMTPPPKGDRT